MKIFGLKVIINLEDTVMKKFLLIATLLMTLPCFAGGVGYINYEKVAENYLYAKNSMREIENKSKEIEQYL